MSMTKEIIPTFVTERLILRPVSAADVTAYEKHFVDYEVISELAGQVTWPYPENGVVEYFRSSLLPNQGKDRWMWGLFLRSNPTELIGAIDVRRNQKSTNRGFWLGRKFWYQGLMTEALRPLMDYAFDELGFESMRLANALGNKRSRRVKEKTGARYVGIEPGSYVNPAYTQSEIWELTKEDWRKWKNGPPP